MFLQAGVCFELVPEVVRDFSLIASLAPFGRPAETELASRWESNTLPFAALLETGFPCSGEMGGQTPLPGPHPMGSRLRNTHSWSPQQKQPQQTNLETSSPLVVKIKATSKFHFTPTELAKGRKVV